jgi:hypothetical protein
MTAPDLIVLPFAGSGTLTKPPQTDPSNFVNFTNGYTPDYEISLTSGNVAAKGVERAVQNYLFNQTQLHMQAWQTMDAPPWYSAMPGGYQQNAKVIRFNGTIWVPYRSLVGSNVSDPLTTPLSWEYVPYAYESAANIPMPSGGSGGSSARIITAATDFNSFGTGTWEFNTDASASGSPHAPAPPGLTTTAGLLQSLSWTAGVNTFVAQQYIDRAGYNFQRAALNGTWTNWTTSAPMDSAGNLVLHGALTAAGVTSSGVVTINAAGTPLIVNSTNSAGSKLTFQEVGVSRGSLGASATYSFVLTNAASTGNPLLIDQSGNGTFAAGITATSAYISGVGGPVTINSTNSINTKLKFQDAGVTTGFIGAASAQSFFAINAANTTYTFQVDQSGNGNFAGGMTGTGLTIGGPGNPVVINSTNSTANKLQWKDNGGSVGYIGASASYALTIWNSIGTTRPFQVDQSGNGTFLGNVSANGGEIFFPSGGYIQSNDATWGMIYRPSTTGATADHLWTDTSGGYLASLTAGGVFGAATINASVSMTSPLGTFNGLNQPVYVSSSNSQISKITMADAGVTRSWIGASSTLSFNIVNAAGTINTIFADQSGNFTAAANVTAYSDERVKTNWRPVQDDFLTKLAHIKRSGVYDRTDQVATQVGVGAQSLREFMPEAVIENDKGELSVAYGNAALVACVELARENLMLKGRLARLEKLLGVAI